MEYAQDRITGDIVEAEQLWLMEHVDKDRYACPGCGIKLTPAAYRPENVVRPYFTARNGDHQPDGDVDGERKLVADGRKQRVSSASGEFPAPYPAKLVLRDERILRDNTVEQDGAAVPDGAPRRPRHDETASSNVNHRRAANTIRPICRTFIHFPYDRHLALHVPGIDATDYRSIFRRLKWDELLRYPQTRIFFAAIRWSKPIENDTFFEVILDAGTRDTDGRLLEGHRVRVAWADWSQAKRTYVRNEVEAARKEAIKAKEEGSRAKAYLFFIGQQDPHDVRLFHVTDHRLTCCLMADIR